ncbi:B3 domain-containing protein REM14-like [Rhodamnia argentea]|uniref:B3 domain-containing protein REM14-like n=1 Tax=Rhodamnia argentea TaxID=178133 RepID=A0A8B8N830_9MYRT|nr:B3 domain-containing protein REM14-like [Rhodamnia argentea]
MAMEGSKRHPSFFKKLLGDFTHKIKIPPAFLKNFKGNVPKTLLVKCGSRSWFIQTEESDEGYHFSKGLAKFVKDLHLELGELVIFSLVDHETFEVVVYDVNHCEKETIPTRNYGKRPCALAEGRSGRSDEVKKEEEESIMGVERDMPARRPHFVRSMRKYEMHMLNLPAAFTRETGLKSKRSVVIEDPLGRMWQLQLRQYANHTSIRAWSSVVKANGFTVGDTLKFEYLQGIGNVIALRIMSRAGRNGAGPSYEKRS